MYEMGHKSEQLSRFNVCCSLNFHQKILVSSSMTIPNLVGISLSLFPSIFSLPVELVFCSSANLKSYSCDIYFPIKKSELQEDRIIFSTFVCSVDLASFLWS